MEMRRMVTRNFVKDYEEQPSLKEHSKKFGNLNQDSQASAASVSAGAGVPLHRSAFRHSAGAQLRLRRPRWEYLPKVARRPCRGPAPVCGRCRVWHLWKGRMAGGRNGARNAPRQKDIASLNRLVAELNRLVASLNRLVLDGVFCEVRMGVHSREQSPDGCP